jgi:Right handed beta helix region
MSLSNETVSRVRRTVRIASLVGIAILICSATPVTARTPHGTRCRGVRVVPGDNIQAMIDNHQRRTTFCFKQGTYHLSERIWTGDSFPRLDLRAGAVIDGGDGDFVGVSGMGAPEGQRGTIILGGTFEHFGNVNSLPRIAPINMADRWILKATELRNNFNAGLVITGDKARVSNVFVHNNGKYGISVTAPCEECAAPRGVIIEHTEIAFNNTRQLDPGFDAGGTKFSAGTDGMIVRYNKIHHNYGSGLWWDGGNRNADIHHNVISDNYRWGILWEISYGGARIHHNKLTGNGVGDGTMNYHNGQIVISNSDGSDGGIEIYENRIAGIAHAVTIADNSDRAIQTKNVYVHDNTMMLRGDNSRVGAAASSGTDLFSAASNNRFEDNTYLVPDRGGRFWVWNGETLSWREWRAYGHDLHGQLRAL